jgi:hypothetical protein
VNQYVSAYVTKRCRGNATRDDHTCAACVGCPTHMFQKRDCEKGLPNRDCEVSTGKSFSDIARGFNNATDLRRVFTMSSAFYVPNIFVQDPLLLTNFKLHFGNKLILSHRIPEIRSIIFEPSLSPENVAFWTSYASAQDAQLAAKTFDINIFNAFSDVDYTGNLHTNITTFAWQPNQATSTPQPASRTTPMVIIVPTPTGITPVEVIRLGAAGATTPELHTHLVVCVALLLALVYY